jgi:hypothetical protein
MALGNGTQRRAWPERLRVFHGKKRKEKKRQQTGNRPCELKL